MFHAAEDKQNLDLAFLRSIEFGRLLDFEKETQQSGEEMEMTVENILRIYVEIVTNMVRNSKTRLFF